MIGNPFCDPLKYTIIFFLINKTLRKQKNLQVKCCGRTRSNKNIKCSATLMNADKGCKTIYHKGRKGKQLLQKSSFPKILKEQTGQTEAKLAFGPRSETENTCSITSLETISWRASEQLKILQYFRITCSTQWNTKNKKKRLLGDLSYLSFQTGEFRQNPSD